MGPCTDDDSVNVHVGQVHLIIYAPSMTHPNVTPDLLDELIGRCKEVLAGVDTVARRAILADLIAIRDHLITAEQRDLGEWIRDLPPESVGNFLADMEVSARQADTESDIGSFISALADWQTTADASRTGWDQR